jgi:hypothetical protein
MTMSSLSWPSSTTVSYSNCASGAVASWSAGVGSRGSFSSSIKSCVRGLRAAGIIMGSIKPFVFSRKSAVINSGGMRAKVSGVNSMSPFLNAAI